MPPFSLDIDLLPCNVAIYKKQDDDFIFIAFNTLAEKTDNIERDQLLGKKLTKIFPGVKDFGLFDVLLRVYETGQSEEFDSKYYKDERISGWRKNKIFKLHDGTIAAIYQDTSMEKELEIHGIQLETEINEIKSAMHLQTALENSEEKFENIVEASIDWAWEVDENNIYTYSSSIVEQILGYKSSEIIGKSPFDFMPEEEADRVSSIFQEYLEHKTAFKNLDKLNIHKNGSEVLLLTSGVPIIDKEGNVLGYRGLDRDITHDKEIEHDLQDKKKESNKAQHLSMHDPLTNLPNRRYFKEHIEHLLAQAKREQNKIAFLYIDLDGFKAVNDEISHQAGDEVLKTIGNQFAASIRANEFMARIGGDEFCMVINNYADKDELKNTANRLIKKNSQSLTIGGMRVEIGMTIGIARYPEDGRTYDELLSAADVAMYQAKRKQKGTSTFAS